MKCTEEKKLLNAIKYGPLLFLLLVFISVTFFAEQGHEKILQESKKVIGKVLY